MTDIEEHLQTIERTIGNINTNEEVDDIREAIEEIKTNEEKAKFIRPGHGHDSFDYETITFLEDIQGIGEIRGYRIPYENEILESQAVNMVVDIRFRATVPPKFLQEHTYDKK